MAKRTKIPKPIETELLQLSARRCCLCYGLHQNVDEKVGQIAHLDQNNSNNNITNLVWLCLVHHSKYDSKTSQHKNYSIQEVKKYRGQLYEVIKEKRIQLTKVDLTSLEVVEPGSSIQKSLIIECPYRGLSFFDVEHASDFYGREDLTEKLLNKIKGEDSNKIKNRFLAIIGSSGSGKSSVARAGLLHALKQGKLTNSASWPQVIFFPGDDPLENMAIALAKNGIIENSPGAVEDFAKRSGKNNRFLHLSIKLYLEQNRNVENIVILSDQFEEVFTSCKDENKRKRFFENLVYASTYGNALIVVTMRSDFFGKCAGYDSLSVLVSDHNLLVGPMNEDEIRKAIVQPAVRSGCTIEPSLVDTLVKDSLKPGALPLLQDTLQTLWNKKYDHTISYPAYQEIGGLWGSLNRRADILFDNLKEEEKVICKEMFLRMTQPGEGTEDTRRRVNVNELLSLNEKGDLTQDLIKVLSDPGQRLITTSGEIDKGNMAYIEVAHEALIKNWNKLRNWINEDREALRTHRRLTEAAKEWADKDKDKSYLFTGARLAEVEEWLGQSNIALNKLEQDFFDAGVMVRDDEINNKNLRLKQEIKSAILRNLIAGFILFITIGFAIIAYNYYQTAQTEKENAIINALTSQAFLDAGAKGESWKKGARFATYAYENSHMEESMLALYKNTLAQRNISHWFYTQIGRHGDPVNTASFSLDGQMFVTASDDNTAKLWNLQGEELASLVGHASNVRSAVFSPDGKSILTASSDETAKLWNLQGKELASLEGHYFDVLSAEFAPDGKTILTTSFDKTAKLWNLKGVELASLEGHSSFISSAVFAPDGKSILTASRDNTAKLWNLQGEELVSLEGHSSYVESARFAPDGKSIVTASWDKTAKLWNLKGKVLVSLEGHSSDVHTAVFAPDGKSIITSSWDETAKLWSLKGNELASLEDHSSAVRSAIFSPDGKLILTASDDKTAKLWNLDGKELASLDGDFYKFRSEVFASDRRFYFTEFDAVFSPDGKSILAIFGDNTAKLWNLQGKELTSPNGHSSEIRTAVFSPDGKSILTASDDNTAKLWNLQGKELVSLEGHSSSVLSAVFASNGKSILTASDDKTAKLWNLEGKELVCLKGHSSSVRTAVFSPDGKSILTASDDKTAKLWSLDGEELSSTKGHSSEVRTAVFAPDGKSILTASSDSTAKLWNLQGRELASMEGHFSKVRTAVFAPDGKSILTASDDDTAKLWNLQGIELANMKGHFIDVLSAIFAPDGKSILTISSDNTAKLWDLQGKEMVSLEGHSYKVVSAIFSSDGKSILTAASDNTAKLWNLQGKELASLAGHSSYVRSAVFAPDGKSILTASSDKTAKLWIFLPDQIIQKLKDMDLYGLTDAEKKEYGIE